MKREDVQHKMIEIEEIPYLATGLTKFVVTWPSGKTFTKFVDAGDAVNERRRQESFAETRGFYVKDVFYSELD